MAAQADEKHNKACDALLTTILPSNAFPSNANLHAFEADYIDLTKTDSFDEVETTMPKYPPSHPAHAMLDTLMKRVRRKRGPRKTHWLFTSYVKDFEVKFNAKTMRFICGQLERCPTTGKLHTQGYVEFYDQKRIGQVQTAIGDPGAHCEARLGSRTAAREYCRKTKSRVIPGVQFQYGVWREDVNRKRTLYDLLKADMTINQLIDDSPQYFVRYHRGLLALQARRQKVQAKEWRQLEIIVLIGPTGTGKTRKATEDSTDYYKLSSVSPLWFDGYEGEKTLIFDDFYGGLNYEKLLQLLDGYICNVPIKGGFVWARWTKVYFTSNADIDDWKFCPQVFDLSALRRRITSIVHMA